MSHILHHLNKLDAIVLYHCTIDFNHLLRVEITNVIQRDVA